MTRVLVRSSTDNGELHASITRRREYSVGFGVESEK